MLLNVKSWELVKHGEFIVGDRSLTNCGITYHPGEEYPKDNLIALYSLYENNQIAAREVSKKKTAKKKKEQ